MTDNAATCTRCNRAFTVRLVGQTWCDACIDWSMDHVGCLSELSEVRQERDGLRELLVKIAGSATYWHDQVHAFVCEGCKYEHRWNDLEKRVLDCGCPCHEARRVAGLHDDSEEKSDT